MNTFVILGTSLLVYAYIVIKLSLHVKNKYISQLNSDVIKSAAKWSLTRIVNKILDFFLAFLYSIIILWPPLLIIMAISQNEISTWGYDITAFAGFSIDLNVISGIEATGLRNQEIHGQSMMTFDTSNLYAWYLFASTQVVSAIVALFVVFQLREMLISLQNGLSFSIENAHRIKRIGFVTITWNVVMPIVQYYGWGIFINDISINTKGIQFYPAFELNILGLLLGLLMMILSGILTEAAQISKEQELTI
jgi:hypothetical protein